MIMSFSLFAIGHGAARNVQLLPSAFLEDISLSSSIHRLARESLLPREPQLRLESRFISSFV